MMKNQQQSEQPTSKHDDILGDLGSCQAAMENGGKCGEVKTLEILREFQQLYESKLNEIKDECSCTSTRIKISMLEDWVKDLTEQNTMLVQVVEELEQEASERVSLLEEKLRTSSKTSFEIMKTFQDYDAQNISNHSDVLQKLMQYQNDINNFSELIKRLRNEGNWNLEGLQFYNITKEDLNIIMNAPDRNLSKSSVPSTKQKELEESLDKMKTELSKSKQKLDEYERDTQNKEILIRDQSDQIEKLNEVVERCNSSVPDRQNLLEELHELRKQLKLKTENYNQLELGSIKKIMSANELLESDINYMKDEMGNLTSELKVLQELLKMSASCPTLEEHNANLVKSLTILQEHSESLVGQLKLSQDQVSREIKLNDMNFGKINQLQNVLDAKTHEFSDVTNKYDQSIKLNKEYENRITELEQEIKDMKKKQSLTDIKNEENNELSCMKEKIDLLNTIMNEKSNEILHLHAALSVKADSIANLVKENDILVKDNKKLAQHAMNIEEQLENYKERCNDLNEKYDKCKDELDKYLHEKIALVDKLENVRKQESLLSTKLKESSEELEKVKGSIKDRDNDVNKSYTSIQEEVSYLKDEIDRLNKIRVRLLTENKKLQEQISSIKLNSAQFENHNMIVADQLQKCLEEINMLQCAKEKLEEKNVELETEVEHLQTTFSDLNHEIRFKHESFINLEHELSETKCSRDEICAESRMVVSKVRAWLDEQKRINVSLNEVIKEKNMVIEELAMEKTLLMKNIKDVCDRYEALSEELLMCRQYVSEINDHHPELLKLPQFKRSYTWGSQNSVGDSQTSSPVFVDEQPFEELYEDNDADPNPAKWMRKVQNMSEDLLKSKKYWQTKMSQSATKRLKPVKEAVKTKSLGTTKSS